MSVKRGDVVLLSWQQKTYNAIVLGLNSTNDSHLGANGEPALHLAVLFDEPLINGKPKPLPIGELPQVSYQYDVVHASHVFPDDFKELHGAEAHKHRGAGEWSEGVAEQLYRANAGLAEQSARLSDQVEDLKAANAQQHEDIADATKWHHEALADNEKLRGIIEQLRTPKVSEPQPEVQPANPEAVTGDPSPTE